MKVIRGAGKAAKFVFWSMPLSVFGIHHLMQGHRQMTAMWKTLANPICPSCDGGVLLKQDNPDDEDSTLEQTVQGHNQLCTWSCHQCGYTLLAPTQIDQAKSIAANMQQKRLAAELGEVGVEEREKLANKHCISSRIFYTCSIIVFVGFLYFIMSGKSIMLSVNWLAIAVMLWIFAMKRSYRAWQVISGRIFEKGTFLYWVKNEKWMS
jgi:hypothetical protein